MVRSGAGGDEDFFGVEGLGGSVCTLHLDGIGIEKLGCALVLIDVVSIEVVRDAFPLHRPNGLKVIKKTRGIHALREIEVQAV